MKGKHLVIGLVLFVIIIVAAIYFTMMSTFYNGGKGMEPVNPLYAVVEEVSN